jgi:hypothetical protein
VADSGAKRILGRSTTARARSWRSEANRRAGRACKGDAQLEVGQTKRHRGRSRLTIMPRYEGSCLCKTVKFSLLTEPSMVSHCHCTMCRKSHGAAFATYVTLERSNVSFHSGAENLTSYNSSSTIVRKFCKICGSNVEWSGHPEYPDLLSIPLALLDTPFSPSSIKQFFEGTQVSWCRVS